MSNGSAPINISQNEVFKTANTLLSIQMFVMEFVIILLMLTHSGIVGAMRELWDSNVNNWYEVLSQAVVSTSQHSLGWAII